MAHDYLRSALRNSLDTVSPSPRSLDRRFDSFGAGVHCQDRIHSAEQRQLLTEKWKLIVANEGNPRGLPPIELFEIQADPKETKNVAAANPAVVEKLSSDLVALKAHAASRAVSGASGVIDEATRQKLESLGYVK